jgi:hypothetical protein
LSAPKELVNDKLAADAKALAASADQTYQEAMDLFLSVSEGGNASDAQKSSGRAGQIYALYGRALLGRATENKEAARFLADAKATRDQALAENPAMFAALPAELVVTKSSTTAPAPAAPVAPAPAAPTPPAPAPAEGTPPPAAPDAPAPAPAPEAPAPAPTPQ